MPKIHKRLLNKLGDAFFQLAANSQDVFWIRSADFQKYIYVNSAYETVWGRSSQSLYRNPAEWVNAITIEDRDRLRQRHMEWLTQPKASDVYTVNYRVMDQQDEPHFIEDVCYPIFDGRTLLAYVGVAKDVTHRQLRLKELDNAGYFFRYFVEKIPGVFWVKGHGGDKQVYISPSYENVWGRSCESLYKDPKSWLQSVLPEDLENGKIDLHFYKQGDERQPHQKYEFRFRIQKPNGEIRWIKDTHFSIMEKGKLLGFAGIAEDVTEDVRRERELRDAKETAEQANRSKSDFLAMMSHELRTPLNAILGMTQILKSSSLSEEQSGQLDVIAQAGQNLLGLLNDLLDFAKLEVGKLSFSSDSVDLRALTSKIIDNMLPLAANRDLQLKLDLSDNVPEKIIGDAKRIRQILVNLLSNAIKFTERGYVRLAINCPQKNHQNATICFTVEDTGIGIEKAKLPSIFNRFQQIDSVYHRKHDGVGLGLSIVKELVEKMGGNVNVSSEVGVGSQFSCVIPFVLLIEAHPIRAGRRPLLERQPATTINKDQDAHFNMDVLVVEDNIINQKISKIMLEQIGCNVDIANCAKDAIEKMKKNYDLVFMDIGLPDMDGFEAVMHIRRGELPGHRVPIVAMTAHVFAHDRERCFDVGMDEVMAKPIMRDDLVRVLKRWVA